MTRPPPTKKLPQTRPTFLTAVAASGVGPSVRQLTQLVDDLPPNTPLPVVAHQLVVKGVLTKFQADRVLAGRADGLTLGPYLLLDQLGEEDGGHLYRARQRVMDRLVCVWVSAADSPERASRLTAARQAAKLAHPHVLTVLDVHTQAARPYVVTEYVDGAGLDAVLNLAGRLPVGRACDLLRQTALAVAHAHERGVAHGRLAAEAVRIGRPGGGGPEGRMAVKLGGFAGGPADARVVCGDLLGLGRLAHHLLAGRPDAPLPAGLPAAVVGLVDELTDANPYRRPGAAVAAERLTPFADADFGLDRAEATAEAQVCPFAEIQVNQPTDICSITRGQPVSGRVQFALVAVAIAVAGMTAVLVAAML